MTTQTITLELTESEARNIRTALAIYSNNKLDAACLCRRNQDYLTAKIHDKDSSETYKVYQDVLKQTKGIEI